MALLYVVFKLAASRNKMHNANRFVLLGILLSSVVLPFADIPVFRETTVVPQFEAIHEFIATPQEILIVPTQNEITETIVETRTPLSAVNWWLVFYLSVIGLLVVRLAFSMARVLQIIRRAEKQNFRDVILAIVKDFIQPFSFLQHIILSEKDFAENKDIVLAHEYAHIQHKHSVDLIICELFTALFWFNPFMWLLRRELKLIHEYQADEAVLNKGIDAKTYQLLVLKKAVGERRFALANNFTQKPILKRIKMMHMKNNKRWTSLKLALFVPVVALLLQAFAKPELIVEKAEAYLPVIAQQDSSEVWLDNWSIHNLSKISNGLEMSQFEIAPPPPGGNQERFPKYDKTKHGDPIASENVMTVLINQKSQILACGSYATVEGVRDGVKKFLNGNPPFEQVGKGPEFIDKNLPLVGDVKISKGVILLRYDAESDKVFVDKLLRSIGKIHLERRQQLAQKEFQQDYFSLSSEKKALINQMVPVRISIMEPKVMSSKIAPPPPAQPKAVNLKVAKDGNIYVSNFYKAPKAKGEKWQLIENKKVTKEELKNYLAERNSFAAETSKKYNPKYEQQVFVLVEVGANDKQVNELKVSLSSLDNLRVVFSTDRTEGEIGAGLSSSLKSEKSHTVSQSGDFSFIPPPFIIPIKSDGSFGAQFKNLNELKASLAKHKRYYLDYQSKGKPTSTITFIAEAGITSDQIDAVKDMLGKVQIDDVRFATQLDPVRISLKNNGDYLYHNERYDFPDEIKEQLIEQKNMVEKWNRQNGTQFDFNVNIMVEDGVSKSKVSEMRELLRSMKIMNINYSSENSSENIKQGRSTDYLNRFDQYDVVVTSDNLQAFNKVCTVEEVKQEVEDGIKTLDNKKTISVLAFSNVSKDRLDAVLNELNQIPFKKVSTTVLAKEQKPVSLAQHKVLLKANGKIDIDNKEYDLNEFQSQINEIGNQSSKTNVAFEVEDNVTYIQIETVKQMLREANIDQVGYSIHKHYVRDTEPGTKIGEESTMFWTTWSGTPDLERVKRAAENFLSGKGNRSLYAGITPDKNASKEDIDAVKQVLQDAGFQSVSIRESRN